MIRGVVALPLDLKRHWFYWALAPIAAAIDRQMALVTMLWFVIKQPVASFKQKYGVLVSSDGIEEV